MNDDPADIAATMTALRKDMLALRITIAAHQHTLEAKRAEYAALSECLWHAQHGYRLRKLSELSSTDAARMMQLLDTIEIKPTE